MKADRLGIEPATCQSQVQRLPQRHHVASIEACRIDARDVPIETQRHINGLRDTLVQNTFLVVGRLGPFL